MYVLDIQWHVENMPRLVGPFSTRTEAEEFARLSIPNGSWQVCPLARPYAEAQRWTAPEPTRPADEHTDAVADAIYLAVAGGASYPEVARRLLTTTHPLVHAALAANLPADVMLAALVRAGVLTEEPWRVKCLCGKTLEGSPDEVSAWTRAHDDSPKASHIVVWDQPPIKPWTRRHVTQGEVAP